jgi:hypothetical protein
MNTEQDKLTELQKVLALKRHEQPPTQFFHKLSGNVIQRLQTPEPSTEPTFRQKLGLDFDTKPVLVCATAVGVCGLLLLGLISSQHVEPPAAPSTNADAMRLSLVPLFDPHSAATAPVQIAPVNTVDAKRRSVDPVIVGEGSPLKALAVPANGSELSIPPGGLKK